MATDTEKIKAAGRRKNAVAAVQLKNGDGKMSVNGRAFQDYFTCESMRAFALQPLKLANAESKFDVRVSVAGGGQVGQAGALRHALARALVKADASLKEVLKNSGFLTRDARMKERKKSGQPGARKRFQFSKR